MRKLSNKNIYIQELDFTKETYKVINWSENQISNS